MNNTMVDVVKTLKDIKALVDNLLLLLSEKEKLVIQKRFCLDGGRKYTLEEIGQEFSVTRERIRQIEKNALAKMKRNVFNTALRHMHDYVGSLVTEYGGLVREEKLVKDVASVVGNDSEAIANQLHFSLVLHDGLDCIGNTITFHPYIREQALSDYSLKFASNHLVNQLHKYGDVKGLSVIHDDLKDVLKELGFDVLRTRSLVGIDKRLTLLDNDLVGLLEWRHIRPRTLRDKILYVLRQEKDPLHFSGIAEKISAAEFDNRSVNVQAVHNELIRHNQFILIGRGIYALEEWGYQKGTVIEVIERVLTDNEQLSEEEIVKMVLDKRQVKKITILLALKNGDKFEPYRSKDL